MAYNYGAYPQYSSGASGTANKKHASGGPTFECDFTWRVEDFSSISSRVVKSPLFSGGADGVKVNWELWLHPYGVDEIKEYVSLDLYMASCNNPEVDVDFNLSIVNPCNEKCFTMTGSEVIGVRKVFDFQHFVKRAELMDKTKNVLIDGYLKIHCNIVLKIGRLLKYTSSPSVEPKNVVMTESCLPEDFLQLYVNQKLCDVTVEVNEKQFMAHKAVLAARSPVFASMFDNNMMESKTNRVVISDFEPEVIVELLRFMYSDQVENLDEVACGLLACAEKYELHRLKVTCEESIRANLSVENAADVLLMADLHRATWLKQQALDFIKVHPLKITQTDGWKVLMNHPRLVAEAFQSVAAVIDGK